LKINRAYRVELDPNNVQRTTLLRHAGCARWAYNWGLRRKVAEYEAHSAACDTASSMAGLVARCTLGSDAASSSMNIGVPGTSSPAPDCEDTNMASRNQQIVSRRRDEAVNRLWIVLVLGAIAAAICVQVDPMTIGAWLTVVMLLALAGLGAAWSVRDLYGEHDDGPDVDLTSVPTWALKALVDKAVYNILRDSDHDLVTTAFRALTVAAEYDITRPEPDLDELLPTPNPVVSDTMTKADGGLEITPKPEFLGSLDRPTPGSLSPRVRCLDCDVVTTVSPDSKDDEKLCCQQCGRVLMLVTHDREIILGVRTQLIGWENAATVKLDANEQIVQPPSPPESTDPVAMEKPPSSPTKGSAADS